MLAKTPIATMYLLWRGLGVKQIVFLGRFDFCHPRIDQLRNSIKGTEVPCTNENECIYKCQSANI